MPRSIPMTLLICSVSPREQNDSDYMSVCQASNLSVYTLILVLAQSRRSSSPRSRGPRTEPRTESREPEDRAIMSSPCSSSRFFPPTESPRAGGRPPPALRRPGRDPRPRAAGALGRMPPLARRPRDRRTPSRSSSTCPACLAKRVRVLFRGDVLIVAGEKAPPPTASEPELSPASSADSAASPARCA